MKTSLSLTKELVSIKSFLIQTVACDHLSFLAPTWLILRGERAPRKRNFSVKIFLERFLGLVFLKNLPAAHNTFHTIGSLYYFRRVRKIKLVDLKKDHEICNFFSKTPPPPPQKTFCARHWVQVIPFQVYFKRSCSSTFLLLFTKTTIVSRHWHTGKRIFEKSRGLYLRLSVFIFQSI